MILTTARRRDSLHGTSLLPAAIWQSTRVIWRVGVLRADGTLDDMAGIDSVELRVTGYGGTRPGAFRWLTVPVPAADFATPEDAAAVAAGTGWHAEFVLDELATTLPVEDSGSRTYWWEIRAAGAAGPSVLGAGQLVVRGTGEAADRYATTAELARLWVDWPVAVPDDPAGTRGSETFDPETVTVWKKVSVSPHLWIPLTGGSGLLSGQVLVDGVAATIDGAPAVLTEP